MIKSKSGYKNGFQDTLELRSCIVELASSVFVTTGIEVSILMTQDGVDRKTEQDDLELKEERAFCTRVKNSGLEEAKYQ